MIAPKKTIPKLVVGMLALTGCATTTDGMPGGGGGSGGSGGAAGMAGSGGTGGSGGAAGMAGSGGIGGMTEDDLTIAARAWCMKLIECYYDGADPENCINGQVERYGDESAECQAAAIGYFECVGEHEGCLDFDCGDVPRRDC